MPTSLCYNSLLFPHPDWSGPVPHLAPNGLHCSKLLNQSNPNLGLTLTSHMYHLSSSSLRNLFTTGDPISSLSQEFPVPKSNTKPPDEDDEEGKGEESSSLELGFASFGASGFESMSKVEFWSSVLVFGFVEQRAREKE
ncbi:hypothetical protein TorRG33x02_007000 [Trema orientale]|uniref:Uncharacterized protein n=1 Tax=Trema orientale TaxID=63057 RepID=A0A2P5G0D0_TREOI|nr:hypothetical protein TorRG33x02_007000 [Trema orientale]